MLCRPAHFMGLHLEGFTLGGSVGLPLPGTLHNPAQGCLPLLAAGQLRLQLQDLRGEARQVRSVMPTRVARGVLLGVGGAELKRGAPGPQCSSGLAQHATQQRARLPHLAHYHLLDRTPTPAQSHRIQPIIRPKAEALLPISTSVSTSSRGGCISGGAHHAPQNGP